MIMRLIDADTLIKEYLDHCRTEFEIKNCCMANENVISIIQNFPTADAIPNEEGCEMYNKGYMSGYETCKKDVIRSIAKQYNEHNELVPSWLHIGNMRETDNDK